MEKNTKYLILLFIFIMLLGVIMPFLSDKKPEKKASFHIKPSNYSFVEVPLRPLSELSGLSKKEILNKREFFVKKSLVFGDLKNYTSSSEVYKIEDNLPWISVEQIAKYGIKDNPNIAKGLSRSSAAINNPELLISLNTPDYRALGLKGSSNYLLAKKLLWDKNNNTLKAYFNMNPILAGLPLFIDETNARDLGYNWIYCKKKKNIRFFNPQKSFKVRPYKLQGCYQKGFSCGLKGGCNNYSPYQEELVFGIIDLPSYLEIKLWKDKPHSIRQKADINYIMVFE